MNYRCVYDCIIDRAKDRILINYKEKHHIIPRCLGGKDDKENLVWLTAREHFICHFLLTKIYNRETIEWYKMVNAFLMMKCNSVLQERYFNSRLYDTLRNKFSLLQSKKQKGEGNSQFGTIWMFNDKLRKNKKVPKNDLEKLINDGWKKGRKLNFDQKIICKKCGSDTCKRPDICNKHQMIITLINFFGLDNTTFGSENFYYEYDRVVEMIYNEYHVNMLSTVEISKKYGISSQRVDSIFKSIGITPRSYQEGIENFKKKSLTLKLGVI